MFKLLIECSKDIDELHINFSDGTSSVVEKNSKNIQKSKKDQCISLENEDNKIQEQQQQKRKPLENYLDTEQEFTISQEIVEKPNIPIRERTAKIDPNLQSLDL